MTDLTQLVQGSAEWRQARCGSLGASDIHKALTRTKTGWGFGRADIMTALAVENLTGKPTEDGYQSSHMLIGQEREPLAREAYCWARGVDVVQVGMVVHPRIKGTHASPDGLVGVDGGIEIKCPKQSTHLATLCGASIEQKYKYQCYWTMACTERKWWDWVSFDPTFPPEMQLYIERIERDDKAILELEALVQDFLGELAQLLAGLRNRYMQKAA
jgi:hypothetical protein